MGESTEPPEDPAQARPVAARSYVVAARLLLLLFAALAGVAGVAVALRDPSSALDGAHYVCPMHPEVRSVKPSQCPICGMALELDTPGSGASAMSGAAMPGMPDLTAVENVRQHKVLDFVRMHALPIEVRELRGAAWVEADRTISAVFYADQADVITADDAATFSLTRTPEVSFAVQLGTEPRAAWDRSTFRLHFVLKGSQEGKPAASLMPGQVGWLEVQRKPRSVLMAPANAVLQSAEGPYVLRSLGGFKFEKRPIEVAEIFRKQGVAVVLSGLQAQDRVVSRATFFLDADRRLESRGADLDWGKP